MDANSGRRGRKFIRRGSRRRQFDVENLQYEFIARDEVHVTLTGHWSVPEGDRSATLELYLQHDGREHLAPVENREESGDRVDVTYRVAPAAIEAKAAFLLSVGQDDDREQLPDPVERTANDGVLMLATALEDHRAAAARQRERIAELRDELDD